MASSSHSTPASSSQSCKYDVFLSFRGEDTRKTFVDHLYSALEQRLIHTYKDDETLPRGESISSCLITAIEESHIVVIVFSTNYANSSWCLEELAHIMKCKNERGLIVMPVFYDVEPSEVRKQTGKFGKGFAEQVVKNSTKFESWQKALVDASEISGWEINKIANGHEAKVIKEIVDTIFRGLFSSNSHVDEGLVGMAGRLHELESLLEIWSDGVRMVGIWGVGGGGKTTLATSVYMKISHHFEGCCIVENIREKSSEADGLEKLQENILSAVFNTKLKIFGIADGKNKIKSMLCHRKVFVVLDDVDKLEQLEALAGSRNWFGNGSRIIITTRDENLLNSHKVDNVYPLRLLSNQEAILLFNKHACNEKKPIKDYDRLSINVVCYAAGLPLAIKVLGSFLCDKNEEEWMSALARLKASPEMKIVEKLKISYDGLEKVDKELFLDIACFFRGWYSSKDACFRNAREILEACGFQLEIGIKVLRQKSLITIDEDGRFGMHDLVQEMGHYIVRGEHPNNPEYHSRIWIREEIINMSLGDATKENDKIEAIEYLFGPSSHLCKVVSNMKRLRWLVVDYYDGNDGVPNSLTSCFFKSVSNMKRLMCVTVIVKDRRYDEGPTFLSNELRYISWVGYTGISFPDSFQPVKLRVLILQDSLQKVLWKGYKSLPCLKVLELGRMKKLVSTPDFDRLPCLQKLTLHGCEKLKEIHPSFGNHRNLEYAYVSSCLKLRTFPTIVHMEKLNTLEVLRCLEILEFPEIQGKMGSLVNLSLNRVGIKVLPSSIAKHCTNLTSLILFRLYNLKRIEFNFEAFRNLKEFVYSGYKQKKPHQFVKTMVHQFPRCLQKLWISSCNLQDGGIPSELGELTELQELYLINNKFSRLDFSLLRLTRLKLLNLRLCSALVELPKLPSNVAVLFANECCNLKAIGDSLTNCKCLCLVSLNFGGIINDGDRVLETMLQGNGIENGGMVLRLQGVKIAKGFIPGLCRGGRCRLQLPNINWCNDFSGFLMCAVFPNNMTFSEPYNIRMKQVNNGMGSQHHDIDEDPKESSDDDDIDVPWKESDGDRYRTWVGYVSFGSLIHTSWWEWAQTYKTLSFSLKRDFDKNMCSGFGVRLVNRKSGSGSTGPTASQFSNEICGYTPNFTIEQDSAHILEISLGMGQFY